MLVFKLFKLQASSTMLTRCYITWQFPTVMSREILKTRVLSVLCDGPKTKPTTIDLLATANRNNWHLYSFGLHKLERGVRCAFRMGVKSLGLVWYASRQGVYNWCSLLYLLNSSVIVQISNGDLSGHNAKYEWIQHIRMESAFHTTYVSPIMGNQIYQPSTRTQALYY